jgi:putative transposase
MERTWPGPSKRARVRMNEKNGRMAHRRMMAGRGEITIRQSQPDRFLLFDRDAKFGADVVSAVRDMGSQPTRAAFGCPWQNGVAERWVGSCQRDLLDHVIILNERHLRRLMSSYLLYYHQDRTHLGLAKDTPAGRPTEIRSARERKIQFFPRLGGLHHRYAMAA